MPPWVRFASESGGVRGGRAARGGAVAAHRIFAAVVCVIAAYGSMVAVSDLALRSEAVAKEPAATSSRAALPAPATVAELATIERKVTQLTDRATKATVAVRMGRVRGTAVIVTKDGYALTAAHVAGKPGIAVRFTLHDGREATGVTLGVDRSVDAGLMKITDPGEWPFAGMAADEPPALGSWCVALGHPGGHDKERGAVVRLGRVLSARRVALQTDCTLVGGDSGGPLFDLEGNILGIHSRIGASTAWNFHVPVAQYRKSWDRMAKSEDFGESLDRPAAVLGVTGDEDETTCRIVRVAEGMPADAAGLKAGDIIVRFDDAAVKSFADLAALVKKKEPGDEVKVEVQRDGKPLSFKVVLASRD